MRYSIEPRDRVYVKWYRFLSLAKNLSNKYSQKLIDTAKKSATDALKTASKRAIQKTAEETDDLIGNKIADTRTGRASPKDVGVSKKSNKNLSTFDEDTQLSTNKKGYISPK